MADNFFDPEHSGTALAGHPHRQTSNSNYSYLNPPQQYSFGDQPWGYPSHSYTAERSFTSEYPDPWPRPSTTGHNEMTPEPNNELSTIARQPHESQQVPSSQQAPGAVAEIQSLGSSPEAPLRCTDSSCKAKDEVFKSKAAYKRHMESHTKPYTCPDTKCKRNKSGFSRKDNLNVHLQNHRKAKVGQRRNHERFGDLRGKRAGGDLCDMLLGGVTAGRVGGPVKGLSKGERTLLLKLIIKLMVDDEDEEGDDHEDEDEEEEEEDDEE